MQPQPRKIVVVAAHDGRENAYTEKLLPELTRLGFSVTYLGWDRRKVRSRVETADAVQYRMLMRGFGYNNRRLLIGLVFWFLRATAALIGTRSSLVVAIDFEAALPTLIAGRLRGHRVVYCLLDQFGLRPSTPPALRSIVCRTDLRLIGACRHVVVPDECRILDEYASVGTPFTVIHNASPDYAIVSVKERSPALTVLASGYLGRGRGILNLIEATSGLTGVNVVLQGSIRDRHVAEAVKVADHVVHRQRVDVASAAAFLAQVDVIFAYYDPVHPINRLAASNKWGDSMMAGRPILVNSEVLKSEWLVREGIALVSAYDDIALLRANIVRLRDDRNGICEMGRRARRLYESAFNWGEMVRRWSAVLDEAYD